MLKTIRLPENVVRAVILYEDGAGAPGSEIVGDQDIGRVRVLLATALVNMDRELLARRVVELLRADTTEVEG